MSGPRIGSLFSGYGGLEVGVQAVLGGQVVWHCEYEPPTKKNPKPTQAAARVLAHRFPGVPNHGDISAIDWADVEPVDVLTGGFPCQDVSAAGKRAGIAPGTRSGLWSEMHRAIVALRPSLVVIENVRGLLNATAEHPAHGDLEPCPWCVGDASQRSLRALGAVLGDLADLGYDASWQGLRAADVGAPHGRFRVFIVAWPDPDAARIGCGAERRDHRVRVEGLVAEPAADPDRDGRQVVERVEPGLGARGDVDGRGQVDWGVYGPAVHRWERLTRPAPSPTETGAKGGRRLSPAFVEWMQGLPAGWVTDVPGITRNEALKALGNGVVPQQAAAALRLLLDDVRRAAA